MRKTLILFCFIALSVFANAQFLLTPDGVINESDKDYVVYDFQGKTHQELYDAVHLYINSRYVNPKYAISVVKGQSITVNGVSEGAIYRRNLVTKTMDIDYTITFLFKDGKLRVNNPVINRLYIMLTGLSIHEIYIKSPSIMAESIYSKKGKLLEEKTKNSIEKFFNGYIADIRESINTKENTDW